MMDCPHPKFDLAALTIAAALAAPMAAATDFPNSDYLTGNWGGARDRWKEQGVTINLGYTAEPMANVSGGEIKGGTYADNIGLNFGFDLERLLGIGGTDLLIQVSKRDGLSVSERFVAPSEGGNLFTVQELYGGQNVKLANVQFNTRLLDDRLNLAYGRLIANDDFLRSPLYCQFFNNSFCGSPKPVFLQNPFTFTAYPLATWGARARYDTPARNWTIQAAVYDGDPEGKEGDPASPSHNDHGTSWGFGDNGVTLAGEIHYHVNRDSKDALPGVYKIGGYYMTGEFQNVGRLDNATETGNAMGWVLADQMLYRESAGADRGLSGFGAVVFSLTDDVNPMTWYFNTGLIYEGLFRARPRDTTGLAITSGWFGDRVNVARNAQDLAEKDYEAVIELNHKFVLGHGIAIQPDLQYVIRPAGTGDIDNALLIGAKVSVQF
ncbi:carbohydrate porin [Thiocystis violascens]|uniref:Carbohydrate-selective porin n=1 Tax=Thiocystis violascens (strain ATCC 17096 / DSM 198 / 6111) TaxID=765911 RepID=I3Y5R6_THIV6|nr:carbohydrate porin [Thiocystis violascens]AFL72334.1 carbohydrate-selective porin [Thiocystis violascens DSM 198]